MSHTWQLKPDKWQVPLWPVESINSQETSDMWYVTWENNKWQVSRNSDMWQLILKKWIVTSPMLRSDMWQGTSDMRHVRCNNLQEFDKGQVYCIICHLICHKKPVKWYLWQLPWWYTYNIHLIYDMRFFDFTHHHRYFGYFGKRFQQTLINSS